MKIKTIGIGVLVSKNLATRKAADIFFDKIDSLVTDKIDIDFDSVSFMSRSFADEYLQRKKCSKKIIEEKNLSEYIKNIFKSVSKESKKDFIEINVIKASPLMV